MEKSVQKKNKSNKSMYFFVAMILLYIILWFVNPTKIIDASRYVLDITIDIIPILVLVYVFMLGMSFLNEKKLRKTIEKSSSLVKYFLMSVLGTLSHGPIYAWYPFLKDLNEKGVSKGNVSAFLYSRGIKLTLLPMLIAFFDFKFALVLTIVTFVFAIIQGILIDLTEKNV